MSVPQVEPSGILLIDKHAGATSHDIVYKVRRALHTKRVGHTGTLDPLANGVLVMLIGRAAKAAEYLSTDRKAYIATLRLGLTTDTEDVTGKILTESDDLPIAATVAAVAGRFLGEIEQIPPMYSALKVGGKKLCDLAREGKTVERAPRPITIYRLDVTSTDTPTDYILNVECSSGTYIRTLCADIGNALGCGGVMATLERRTAGGFDIESSHTVAELEEMSEDERLACLIPTERLFDALPAVCLPEFFEKLCRSGCEIYQKKIRTAYEVGSRVRICSANGEFFAIGEVREYDGGSAIKALKLFNLD